MGEISLGICLRFFALLYLAQTVYSVRCPGKDWYYRKGTDKCYYIINKNPKPEEGPAAVNKNFNAAIEECKIRGGKLATFESTEEVEWVVAKLTTSSWFWVGMTYENGRWEWYNGETYRPYTPISGLIIPPFPEYMSGDEQAKRMRRLSLYNRYNEHKFDFAMEVNTTSNGYICKGDWSGRPACDTENGWRYHDGRCIKYFPDPLSFDSASLRCAADNGFITVPTTAVEDNLYRDWLRTTMKVERGWIGIAILKKTAATTVDTVVWQDGTLITQTPLNNWVEKNLTKYIESLPNNRKYCGEVYTRNGYYDDDNGWDDWDWGTYIDPVHDWMLRDNCTQRRPFACEKPLDKCPYGWKEYDDMCYQINLGEDRLRSWTEARAECQLQNADLVVIQKTATQSFLVDVLSTYFDTWSEVQHHYWLGLKGNDQSFTWVNESQPIAADVFSAWNGGKVPEMEGESCVYMDGEMGSFFTLFISGKWNATLCTQKMGYICQAPYTARIPSLEQIFPAHTCEAPFVKYHEGCYLQVRDKKNRDEAQRHCENIQSNLAFPISLGENLWFSEKLTNSDIWLGIKITGKDRNQKWIYQYSDGTTLAPGAYTKWDDFSFQSPTTTNFDRFCAAMAGGDSSYPVQISTSYSRPSSRGYWYHLPCTEQREFFCYHPGNPIQRPTDNQYEDPVCGAGWFRNGDNCYMVEETIAPWRSAKQTCQNMHPDSDLLSITTREEHKFINDIIVNNYTDQDWLFSSASSTFWLGLYSEKDNDWHWPFRNSNDKWRVPLSLTDWATSEPLTNLNTKGKPRCAFIRSRALYVPKWYTEDCTKAAAFICKRVAPLPGSTAAPEPVVTPAPGYVLGCPKGWVEFHGRCTQFELTTKSWAAARDDCRSQKADLLTVRNAVELMEATRFGTNSWIGLNSVADPGSPRIFSWSNKVPLTYTPWDSESASSNATGKTDVNCGALTRIGFSMYSCAQLKSFVCEMPLQSVLPNSDTDVDHSPGCNRHGFGFRNNCYYFGKNPTSEERETRTFNEAVNFCKNSYGGNLVVIDSKEEQDYINTHAARYGIDYWIGLKQDVNVWNAFKKWITGENVQVTNWGIDQPEILNGDRCVAISGASSEVSLPGDWYVDGCSQRKYALCESNRAFTVPTRPPAPVTPKPTGCPRGWETDDEMSSCYKAYSPYYLELDLVPWQAAEDFCRRFRNGHLVSITSAEEERFITYNLNFFSSTGLKLWIGLRQQQTFLGKRWFWSDGSVVTTLNLNAESDHSSLESTACVAIETVGGKWTQQNCQQAHGWVCEVPKGEYINEAAVDVFPTAIPINATCGESTNEGEWYFDPTLQQCTYFSYVENTWEGARRDCRNMGTHLITIKNKKHHDFIVTKSSQVSGTNADNFWIGLFQVDYINNEYEWDDRGTSTFRAWAKGQPDPRGTQRCVAQNTVSGLWADFSCGVSQRYICARTDRVPEEQPTAAPDVGHCPEGWIEYRNKCYHFSKENVTMDWDSAWKTCRYQELNNSDLVSIHHMHENDFILSQMVSRQNQEGFWIGMHDQVEPTSSWWSVSEWAWVDNTPVDFLNWLFQEPAYIADKHCIEFRSRKRSAGKWTTADCGQQRPFICRADKNLTSPPQPVPPTKCPAGYTEFNGNCYIMVEFEEGKGTFADAVQKCRSIGDGYGELATISDAYENAFLHAHGVLHSERLNNSGGAWINMKEHYGHFSWENTCPVVFSNFMDLSPVPLSDMCVKMWHRGKWYTENCQTRLRAAVCQRRFTPCPAVHETTEYDWCPVNFPSECDRACYRVDVPMTNHDETYRGVTYKQAKEACESFGGELASIRTEKDQMCLSKYIETAVAPMWFGLMETTNAAGQPVWRFMDSNVNYDESAQFLNWAPGQPDNSSTFFGRKSCGQINPNGTWISAECGFMYGTGFVCESRKVRRDVPRRTTVLPPIDGSRGLSGGETAGVVIGVLLAVALVGGVVFMVRGGKTPAVMASIRNASTRVTSGVSAFGNKNYAGGGDRERISEDPTYKGESYS